MGSTERQLVSAIQRYRDLVHGIAYAATGDAAAADDLCQETFVLAWRKLPELTDRDNLGPWLRRTVRNLSINHNRKNRYRAPEVDVADRTTPHDYLAACQLVDRVHRTVANLPGNQREALVVFYRCQSHTDVAELLGISRAAARQRVSRAKQALRIDVDEYLRGDCRRGRDRAAFVAAVALALGLVPATASAASSSVRALVVKKSALSLSPRWLFLVSAAAVLALTALTLRSHAATDSSQPIVREAASEEAQSSVAVPEGELSTRPELPVLADEEHLDEPELEGLADQPLIVGVVKQTHPEADLDGDGTLDEDELLDFAENSDSRLVSTLIALREQELTEYQVMCRAVSLSAAGVSENHEIYDVSGLDDYHSEYPMLTLREATLSWVATVKGADDRLCVELTVRQPFDPEHGDSLVSFSPRVARIEDGKIRFDALYALGAMFVRRKDNTPVDNDQVAELLAERERENRSFPMSLELPKLD